MTHPCLVTLDDDSVPRVLFAGDRLVEVELPAGTRVLYPKPPLEPLADVDAAIHRALQHPHGAEPLQAKLRPGMKVTIALFAVSLLPPLRRPDVRQRVLEIVLRLLGEHGVDDVEIILATGLGRRLKPGEIRRLVGSKVFRAHWPQRLYNLDPEGPEQLVAIGETERGEVLELSRRAADSDLVIGVNVLGAPVSDGHALVVAGLSGYSTWRSLRDPESMRSSESGSGQETSVRRLGRLARRHLDVFSIELTLDDRSFAGPLDVLGKNEDDLGPSERRMLRALVDAARLPRAARRALWERVPAPHRVTGVFAGETEAAHALALRRHHDQVLVPIEGQADVVVAGIPPFGPYDVGATSNPLLLSLTAQGHLFGAYRGAPLVKPGGTLILTHPCTDKFDHEQHAPYIDFVHRLLVETRDSGELQSRYEEKYATNPAFVEMFRRGHAYHPAHAFFMWYWGEAGRRHLGRVIVVGADNEYVPRLLGYETAPNMSEALYRAKGAETATQDVLCLHAPPAVVGDLIPSGGARC